MEYARQVSKCGRGAEDLAAMISVESYLRPACGRRWMHCGYLMFINRASKCDSESEVPQTCLKKEGGVEETRST